MITPTSTGDALAMLRGRWRWRKATSLAHLADLRADHFARILAETDPNDLGPRWTMYSVFVALGRAGVVVQDWRPGTHGYEPDLDTTVETRACVTGLAGTDAKDWLDNLLYYAGRQPGTTQYELAHVFELYAPGCEEYDTFDGDDTGRNKGNCWVERINGDVTARIGEQMNTGHVYRAFPTRRRVQAELRQAWQIAIYTPTWGDPRMWSDLLRLLAQPQPANPKLSRSAENHTAQELP